MPYANPVVGVYCKPPPDFTGGEAALEGLATLVGGRTGPSVSEAIQWLPVLDLFSGREGGLQRLSIVRGVTDFTGLGDLRGGTDAEDMATTVAECESRFDRLTLDTRLENVRPRRRFLAGDASFDPDLRKMYSFGTLLLRQVLDSISSELRDVTQYEFGARLGYVLSRHGTD